MSARRTTRLGDLQRNVALALGGEAAAKPAERLAIPTSPDTLLRMVANPIEPEMPAPTPRRDYHALRTLTGVAPVTKRSGKSCRVEMRQACCNRLRTAVYHWARVATQHDAGSGSRYTALRARGHSHGRALRTVADRLLGIACVMLAHRPSYDPKHKAAREAKTA